MQFTNKQTGRISTITQQVYETVYPKSDVPIKIRSGYANGFKMNNNPNVTKISNAPISKEEYIDDQVTRIVDDTHPDSTNEEKEKYRKEMKDKIQIPQSRFIFIYKIPDYSRPLIIGDDTVNDVIKFLLDDLQKHDPTFTFCDLILSTGNGSLGKDDIIREHTEDGSIIYISHTKRRTDPFYKAIYSYM
jgi:hypothetical protein